MTAPVEPGFEQLLGLLGAMSSQLTGKGGEAVRTHVERLAQILAADGPDDEQRGRAAAELEQLVGAIGGLAGASREQAGAAARGMELGQLAEGLRAFAAYLRAPSAAGEAEVAQLVERLAGPPRPVPLDELRVDGTIEALAIESARRHGLSGDELVRAAERMKRQMSDLLRDLELGAQQEAARARAAADAERLIDAVIQTRTPLGDALASSRATLVQAFRTVELLRVAEGLRVFGEWLSAPADDPVAHVAALRTQLAEVLGPPTMGDPTRSEAERRADAEREIRARVDEIFRTTRPA